ncbi:hypothetical protein CTI12_AA400590 [Artemisia annua]|uniref:Protein kinase domain-containing protein n=1 Tax=Artemisia annua TaxID=35608 RepID=A0A2U1MB66_ARTAN|nr:hypothetical protein CTI12_AA400590 [Artemisia annua]
MGMTVLTYKERCIYDHGRLQWQLRLRALLGAGKGLAFLHNQTPHVIYRDFTPSNILLDQGYNGVLGDFGIARDGPTEDRSHISTRANGTLGYICPYYITTTRCLQYFPVDRPSMDEVVVELSL